MYSAVNSHAEYRRYIRFYYNIIIIIKELEAYYSMMFYLGGENFLRAWGLY